MQLVCSSPAIADGLIGVLAFVDRGRFALLLFALRLVKCAYGLCLVSLWLLAVPSSALATTVWSGPTISFSKVASADPTLEANQDRITDAVWITRGISGGGIFNAATEELFLRGGSPADTEWAWDLAGFNAGLEIAASNYENLEFNEWTTAHGGEGGGPPATVGIAGVVHLISDDIYIDIMFTSWGAMPAAGGSFSYLRSTVPEPDTALLLAIGLMGFSSGRLRSVSRRSMIKGRRSA